MLERISPALVSAWIAVARVRVWLYKIGVFRSRALNAPVISVGNLTFGGTGKTPFVLWLASGLQARGLRPSILTRGYRRSSKEPVKVHAAGAAPEAAHDDGEEVQIYLRHLAAPVGISASRFQAGAAVENVYPIDVHLLDDGFQHLRLRRTLNIVLIDASNPWGSRTGWPHLMREGFSALNRADVVVLTRCELAESNIEKLKNGLWSYRPGVPIYLARTEIVEFVDARDSSAKSVSSLRDRKCVAFCGLGNPQNFFQTLERIGLHPTRKIVFADHYKYGIKDIGTLANYAEETGADFFLTTEKDVLNLPSNAELHLPVYWARMKFALQEEDRLTDWIIDKIGLSDSSVRGDDLHRNSEEQHARL